MLLPNKLYPLHTALLYEEGYWPPYKNPAPHISIDGSLGTGPDSSITVGQYYSILVTAYYYYYYCYYTHLTASYPGQPG